MRLFRNRSAWARFAVSTAILIFTACRVAHAQQIAYEPFNYGAGLSLTGQNGGSGFSDAWSLVAGPNATVSAGSLNYQSLPVNGNRASDAGGTATQRDLSTTLGTSGTTAYVSFLMRPTSVINGYGGLNIGNAGGGSGVFVGEISSSNNYGMDTYGGNGGVTSAIPIQTNATAFLVVRFDFVPGADTIRLYVNPQPGGTEPAVADATKTDLDMGSFTRLSIDGSLTFDLDEIHAASTYIGVTAAPEPASLPLGLLAIGVVSCHLLCRRRCPLAN